MAGSLAMCYQLCGQAALAQAAAGQAHEPVAASSRTLKVVLPLAPAQLTSPTVACEADADKQQHPVHQHADERERPIKQQEERQQEEQQQPSQEPQQVLSQHSSSPEPSLAADRARRTRRQRVQSSEFAWSDAELARGSGPPAKQKGGGPAAKQKGSEATGAPPTRREAALVHALTSLFPSWVLANLGIMDAILCCCSKKKTVTQGSSPAEPTASSGKNATSSTGASKAKKRARTAPATKPPRQAASQLQMQLGHASLQRQLQSLTHLPAAQAAAALRVTAANFRDLCRSVGIQRWPHRAGSSNQK
jgi:hypothetical protein